MAYTIAFSNQKGGVGKTTTAINAAGILGTLGYKVLLVDVDPQGSASLGLGVSAESLDKTMYNVLIEKEPMANIIYEVRPNVDIAPTNVTLAAAEFQLPTLPRREDRLKNALKPLQNEYDFILIDVPPSLGIFTINALSAANGIVIPMQCSYFSMAGIKLILQTLQYIRQEINENLDVLGILPTMYDVRTLLSRTTLQEVKSSLSGRYRVFDSIITMKIALQEAPIAGETIVEYRPDSSSAREYEAFVNELLGVIPHG